MMVIQPVLAFGQFTAGTMEQPPGRFDHMFMMDCCNAGSSDSAVHSERNMVCGDMASADCVVAANQGSCGTMLCTLVFENAFVSVQRPSNLARLCPHEGYLSVILDTLTPPPLFLKA